jgi:NADH-quinone oxidoreductase subunit C
MDILEKLEKEINSELTTKINSSKINHNQHCLNIDSNDIIDVILFLKTNKNTSFKQLIDITAVDYPENERRFIELIHIILK